MLLDDHDGISNDYSLNDHLHSLNVKNYYAGKKCNFSIYPTQSPAFFWI